MAGRVIREDDFNVPVKVWTDYVEDSAMEQIRNMARLPFAFGHIAIMPDVHTGFGVTIGSVFVTKDVIIPMAVGVDIGCGMAAVKTDIPAKALTREHLKDITHSLKRGIPVGFKQHRKKQSADGLPTRVLHAAPAVKEMENGRGLYQLGTLGGGNHFIELQQDEDGFLWLMLHSGSRHLGKVIADHYHALAKKRNAEWSVEVPQDLNYFPLNTDEGKAYFDDMRWAQDYAMENRWRMLNEALRTLEHFARKHLGQALTASEPINVHHNFAAVENHFGQNVLVHRKGATPAREGQLGIIPGSMGTASYIVRGKGNPESFESCSHGAGRVYGRKEMGRRFNVDHFREVMSGVVYDEDRAASILDESPMAYKDIGQVIADQADLVEPVTRLVPLASVKG